MVKTVPCGHTWHTHTHTFGCVARVTTRGRFDHPTLKISANRPRKSILWQKSALQTTPMWTQSLRSGFKLFCGGGVPPESILARKSRREKSIENGLLGTDWVEGIVVPLRRHVEPNWGGGKSYFGGGRFWANFSRVRSPKESDSCMTGWERLHIVSI